MVVDVNYFIRNKLITDYCFDHVVIKGEIIVVVCDKDKKIWIYFGENLEYCQDFDLNEKYDFKNESIASFNDLTIIQHASNAYQIYFRLHVIDPQGSIESHILLLEVFVEALVANIFEETFEV